MARPAESKAEVVNLLESGTGWTSPDIASHLGVSRNYVDKVIQQEADRLEVIGRTPGNNARIMRLRPAGKPAAGKGRPRAKAWPFKVGTSVRVVGEHYDEARKCVVVVLRAGDVTYELEVK